jgi:hypothetical protein
LHEPSVGLTASVATVPDTLVPVCVRVQETVVAPWESTAVPPQKPVTSGGSTGAAGGVVVDGTVGGADDPAHAIARAAAAAEPMITLERPNHATWEILRQPGTSGARIITRL